MIFRQFQHFDTQSVLELANKYAAFDGTTSESDLAITTHFQECFWVAEEEGKVVGFAYGYFKDVPLEVLKRWGSKKVAQIELIAVHPDHRKKGVGESLVSKLLEAFKKAGADTVLLNCPASAVEARSLYEKIGFDVRACQLKKRI